MALKIGIDPKAVTKKLLKIPKLYKLLFIFLIGFIVFGIFFYLGIMPQLEIKKTLTAEQLELRRTLDRLNLVKNNFPKLKKEHAEVKEALKDVLRQLPDTKDIPNLLRAVSKVSGESRTKLKYFEPRGLQNKDFYAELDFEIRYSGPYHNIAYFFDGVRKLERIIDITSFTLELPAKMDKSVTLEGRGTAKTYVYTGDMAPKTDQKGKGGKGAK